MTEAAAPHGPIPRRPVPRRAITWALCAGVAAVAATVAVGVLLTRDDPPPADVVLVDPGIFAPPGGTSNADVTGTRLPDVAFEDATGAPRSLAEFGGRPIVVNLWYSACAPCARELGDFADVDAELRAAGRDVQFVGLNPIDQPDKMIEFATARGVAYELWRDTERTFGVEIGAAAYPVTLYVDADGNVVEQTGETDADQLRANIDRLFG